MTEYVREWEEVYRALVKEVQRGIDFALQPFANSLDAFLAELFSARLPSDWRDRWHAFVAEQAELGFFVEAVSVEELETWIEQWARFCGLLPSDSATAGPSAVGHKPVGSGKASEKFFDDKLALAQRQLDDIQRVLEALGPRLDAAREGESVDVETEVDRVEELIWCYHDALESARGEWLTQDLAGNAMERLYSLHTPVSFGLPYYTDEQQAQRATQQERKINERLRRRNIVMDWVVTGAEAVETAGTVAGLALGGGAFLQAAKTGGRWAVVKLAAKVAAGEAASRILDQAVEAAGVSQQTLAGVKLAAAVIGFILNHRKSGATNNAAGINDKKRQPPLGGQKEPGAPTSTAESPTKPSGSEAPTSPSTGATGGPLKNRSGDPEAAAAAARTQPYGPAEKPPTKPAESSTVRDSPQKPKVDEKSGSANDSGRSTAERPSAEKPTASTKRGLNTPRLPKLGTPERALIDKARKHGIKLAKARELKSIRDGGKGSGVWTEAELEEIRATGKFPVGTNWHHNPTVANRPDLAGDPSIIRPVRGGIKGHLEAHGGDFRKPHPDEEG